MLEQGLHTNYESLMHAPKVSCKSLYMCKVCTIYYGYNIVQFAVVFSDLISFILSLASP